MSPIPGEPHKRKPHELTMKDGRKVKIKLPGMPAPIEPQATEERGSSDPPRDNPAPPHNPLHGAP